MSTQQFKRKASLLLTGASSKGNNPSAAVAQPTLNLSEFHFTFKTEQQDVESPNNCTVRVFNLRPETVDAMVKAEYSTLILQAGYEGSYGVIFRGEVKQYRKGRESATTTFLDILAADGDSAYNFAVVNTTLASAGNSSSARIAAAVSAMSAYGVTPGSVAPSTGGVLPRGKVLFGMARAVLRSESRNMGATWSLDNGQVNIIPLEGYLPGEAVVLSSLTGLVGIPEQTENGIRARCLLNPKITVGGRVQIDNKAINQLVQANPAAAPVAFNTYTGIQLLANVSNDGLYRVYVAEHEGDTRGQPWYTNLICLAIDPSTGKVLVK